MSETVEIPHTRCSSTSCWSTQYQRCINMTSESKTQTKKRIRVVAAIIRNGGKIFCAQRAYGFLKGKWEFPGGKIEQGETPEKALIREIKEELDTQIVVDDFVMNVVYEY